MEEAAMRCSGKLITATEILDKYIAAGRLDPNLQARALGTAETRHDNLPNNDSKVHSQLQPSCFPPAGGTAAAREPAQNSAACSQESLPNPSHCRDDQDWCSGIINAHNEPIDVDAVLARWQQEHIMSQEAAETKATFNPAPVPSKQRPLQSKETAVNPSGGSGTPKEDLPAEMPEGHPAAANLGSPLAEAEQQVPQRTSNTGRVPASHALYPKLRTPLAKYLLRCLASQSTSDVDTSLTQGEDISAISNSDEENCSQRAETSLFSPSAMNVDAAFLGPAHKHGNTLPLAALPTAPRQQESRPEQEQPSLLLLPSSPAGPLSLRHAEVEAATPGREATGQEEEEELEQAAAEGAMRRGALLAADIRLKYPHLFQGCPPPQLSSRPISGSDAEEAAGMP